MSQVSWVKQLILAIALLALGTLAYWLEYKHKPEQESAEENAKKVFALKDTQVESIRIVDGPKTFEWQCLDLEAKTCKPGDNSKWKLTEPMQARADDSNVNSLVSSLNNLTSTETLDLKDETPEKRAQLLKDYGLSLEALRSPNVRRVDVKTPKGETVAYLGGTHPINESIYALVEKVPSGQKPAGKPDETKVYLVPGYFKSNFDHDLTYWRDKKVLGFNASEIASFQLKSQENGTIHAEKKDGQWVLKTQNGEFPGDIENVDSLLTAASFLTAKDFASDHKTDAKAKAALKGAHEIVSLTLQKSQGSAKEAPAPITLTVYEKSAPKAAKNKNETPLFATASSSDPLYELQTSAKKQLDKSLKDLRLTKLITSMERFGAKRLEFAGKPMGDKPLVLVSQDGKWVHEGDKKEVNADRVQSMLDKLSGNRIKEFLSKTTVPAGEKDGLKFTLGDEKSPKKRQLVFWKSGGKLYARDLESARQEAFEVDSSVTDGLPWDRNYFEKK